MSSLLTYLKIQSYSGRWTWRPMLVTGIAVPLLTMVLLASVTGAPADERRLYYIVTGAITMSVVFECLSRVSQNTAFLKSAGALEFYRTLPAPLISLFTATLSAFFLLALPAILVSGLTGILLFQVDISVTPWVILAFPLASLSIASIGLVIGVTAKTQETASAYSLGITVVSLFIAPVFVPRDALNPMLETLGWLSPATYASTLIRGALGGTIDARFYLSLAVLTIVLIAGVGFAYLKITERER